MLSFKDYRLSQTARLRKELSSFYEASTHLKISDGKKGYIAFSLSLIDDMKAHLLEKGARVILKI
jgi:hypothetical protein